MRQMALLFNDEQVIAGAAVEYQSSFALAEPITREATMPDRPEPVTAKQSGNWYALYFNGHTDEEIAAWFYEKHGYEPNVIIHTGGGKLAGPLAYGPKGEKDAN